MGEAKRKREGEELLKFDIDHKRRLMEPAFADRFRPYLLMARATDIGRRTRYYELSPLGWAVRSQVIEIRKGSRP